MRAHISSTAEDGNSGWGDLVDLRSNPRQIDLLSLGASSNTCLLTQLGSASGLPAGKYQQIRLYLLANDASSGPSPNNCGSGNGFNCVVPNGGSPQMLLLSSEAQTGIKIPSGRIAGGGLTIEAGESVDLNIDFDTCASVLRQGNSQYRLKPTLHAGEVSANRNSISGKVVDADSNDPIEGALVLLEQRDSNNIGRIVHQGLSGADGSFLFCGLANPDGNAMFDVVVAAKATSLALVTTTYNATIAFNVPVGTNLNNLPLVPEDDSLTGSDPATLAGQVTSVGSGGATPADVTLSALQQATPSGGSAVQMTIPVFEAASQPPTVTTTDTPTGPACAAGTDCFNYSLMVPASNPQVGTFSSGSISYTAPAAGTVSYSLQGVAPACTGVTSTDGIVSSITVTPGTETAVATRIDFSGCTAP